MDFYRPWFLMENKHTLQLTDAQLIAIQEQLDWLYLLAREDGIMRQMDRRDMRNAEFFSTIRSLIEDNNPVGLQEREK